MEEGISFLSLCLCVLCEPYGIIRPTSRSFVYVCDGLTHYREDIVQAGKLKEGSPNIPGEFIREGLTAVIDVKV